MIELKQLQEYVALASPHLFAQWKHHLEESKTLIYTQTYKIAHFTFELAIYGYRQHTGQIVTYYQNTPVWSMVFTGRVLDKPGVEPLEILGFLVDTITNNHTVSLRGPKEASKDSMCYKSSQIGSTDDFEGREWIEVDHTVVYRGTFNGGTLY